jgi:hypothetical protein
MGSVDTTYARSGVSEIDGGRCFWRVANYGMSRIGRAGGRDVSGSILSGPLLVSCCLAAPRNQCPRLGRPAKVRVVSVDGKVGAGLILRRLTASSGRGPSVS